MREVHWLTLSECVRVALTVPLGEPESVPEVEKVAEVVLLSDGVPERDCVCVMLPVPQEEKDSEGVKEGV